MAYPNSEIRTLYHLLVLLLSLVSLLLLLLCPPLVQGRRLQAIQGPHNEFALVGTLPSPGTRYYGAKAQLNVWNPAVSREGDYSASTVVISISEGAYMEAGWMVYPKLYNDYQSRFTIYWTIDNDVETGCYNLDCDGFVQVNNSIALGSIITPVSTEGATEKIVLNVLIYMDRSTGNWWLVVKGTTIGYWPASLFSGFPEGAETLEWGGQVHDSVGKGQHTPTDMGNGNFPSNGGASYVCSLAYVDASNTLQEPTQAMLGLAVTNPLCYDAQILPVDPKNGVCILFGGSGLNPRCP